MIACHGKCSVKWNGDFEFGVADSDSIDPDRVAPARAVGAAFVSGRDTCAVVHMDRTGECEYFNVMGSVVMSANGHVSELEPNNPWTLCGPGVEDARLVSGLCRQTRAYGVSVCPFSGHQAAFGYIAGTLLGAGKEKPRMTRFCAPYDDWIEAEYQDFDPKLEGDGYGRMAHLVQARIPVFNQMMRTPSIRAFYGRVLSTGRWWGIPVFLMLQETALKYFPSEILGVRNYAATWVPVEVANTDMFKEASGYKVDVVKIFIASELTPGLGSFLRFHQLMGKEDFVASSDPIDMGIPDTIPVFRWSRAYNVSKDLFDEVRSES